MNFILPQWNAPSSVRAFFTVRNGGVSDPPFASFNLAANVGDEAGAVGENRMRLREHIPASPKWMLQAHTARAVRAEEIIADTTVADAAYTFAANEVCAALVADCVPVLFCTADGRGAAAAHAGWRGLAGGVLKSAADALRENDKNEKLLAWLGPAISQAHYEIGEEVRAALCETKEDEKYFIRAGEKWRADLPKLAARRLRDLGIETTESGLCTSADRRHFFSARRDGVRSGRMAALIWTETGKESESGKELEAGENGEK
ncbi:MAG: peptidoglycan editing factor PgeF [Gammaproteobacteria bacterium]